MRHLPAGVQPGAVESSADAEAVIFTVLATWNEHASLWAGTCDAIPAAADAASLDALLAKIAAMALDLLPDNHPDIDPGSLRLQLTALREAEPAAAWMAPTFDRALRRKLSAAGGRKVREAKAATRFGTAQFQQRTSPSL